MKVICSFLAAVLMLVYFSSCQKGIDWELEDIVTNDSTDLSKIVVLDTTLATGQDTLFLLNFYLFNFFFDFNKMRKFLILKSIYFLD